jgi:hypothetical protein
VAGDMFKAAPLADAYMMKLTRLRGFNAS